MARKGHYGAFQAERAVFCKQFQEHLSAVQSTFQDYVEIGMSNEDGEAMRKLRTRLNFMLQLVEVERGNIKRS